MCASENFRIVRRVFTVITLCSLLVSPVVATNSTEAGVTNAANGASNDTLRTYLQLQEQLHATQMALERNRQESEALAAKNAEAVAARFKVIEEALTAKRVDELNNMKSSMETLKSAM